MSDSEPFDFNSIIDLKEYAKLTDEFLDSIWLRDIISLFEDRFSDFEFMGKLWSSIGNVNWYHSSDSELELNWTFREAGAICAVLHGLNYSDYPIYIDFHYKNGSGNVDKEIADKMKALGWSTVAEEEGLYLIIPPNFGNKND